MLSVLLDADVIIDLHKYGVWDKITEKHKIHIPSIILHKEVYYYYNPDGTKQFIYLEPEIGKTIFEVSCSPDELLTFSQQFDTTLGQEIHTGEKEALVLLQKHQDLIFCTCDHTAIQVLALLDLAERGLSFESLLRKSGITKKLEYKHTEAYFKNNLKMGSIAKIQQKGLKAKTPVKKIR